MESNKLQNIIISTCVAGMLVLSIDSVHLGKHEFSRKYKPANNELEKNEESRLTQYLLSLTCSPTAMWLDGVRIEQKLREQYQNEIHPKQYSFNKYLIDNGCRINDGF